MIASLFRPAAAIALVASLALVPVGATQARDWHRGGYRGGWHEHHRGGGGGAAAAIIGGLIGLGVGAAIANGGYAPPPAYYAPPPTYYPPSYYAPPPAVYYGY
jgi:hypothetical protein